MTTTTTTTTFKRMGEPGVYKFDAKRGGGFIIRGGSGWIITTECGNTVGPFRSLKLAKLAVQAANGMCIGCGTQYDSNETASQCCKVWKY